MILEPAAIPGFIVAYVRNKLLYTRKVNGLIILWTRAFSKRHVGNLLKFIYKQNVNIYVFSCF